ncbi:TraC family protein [Neisseria sp. P0020.S005]|uniref:TraC family protein n=1 Tax=Neisseria sp. P0020.S005 TaxID=3436810 RepID=UPI003F7F7D1E
MSKPDIFEINRNRDGGRQFVSLIAGDDADGIFYYENENAIATMGLFDPLPGWNAEMGNSFDELLEIQYPAGTLMSFHNFGIPDIDEVTGRYEAERLGAYGDESVALAKEAVVGRAEYLRKGTKRKLLHASDAKILQPVCTWTLKIPLKTKHPLDGSEEDYRKFMKECEEFKRLYSQCLSQLRSAGLNIRLADRSEAMAILRRPFDMDGKWDGGIDEEMPLNVQLFPPGTSVDWGVFRQGILLCKGFSHDGKNQNVGILTIDRYPTQEKPWHMSRMIDLIGHPSGSGPQPGMPYMFQTTIHFPNQDKKRTKVSSNHLMTERAAKVPGALKISPRLRRRLAGFKMIQEEITKGGQMVEVCTTYSLFHHSRRQIRESLARMAAYFRSNGFLMRQERLLPAVSFFNTLPMNASPESIKRTFRFKTMPTAMAAHLLPVMDEWRGFGNRSMFTTRRGKPFRFGIFDSQNSNYNGLILGQSGQGKSVLSQRMIQDELSLGTKVWTIDRGMSYVAAAQIAGAQVIDFHPNSNICLNPFTRISDIEREMEILIPIFGKMAKPTEGLDDLESALLMEAIQSVFTAKANDAEVTDVIQYLQAQSGHMSGKQHELAMLLMPFGSTGSMGRWFRGKNNLRTEADWTVLEMSGLATNRHLHDVVLMMTATGISQEMFIKHDGRKRLLWLEECGDLLKDAPFAQWTGQLCSKVRKEDGGVWVVGQTFNQVFATKFGYDIMGSTYTKFMFRQTGDSLEQATREGWFKPSPYISSLLQKIHTVKGEYGEFVLISGEETAGIVRLIETPFNRVLFSTEGVFFTDLKNRIRAGEKVADLIRREAWNRYGDGTFD